MPPLNNAAKVEIPEDVDPNALTKEEQAYLDSRGQTGLPDQATPPAPAPAPAPAEGEDDADDDTPEVPAAAQTPPPQPGQTPQPGERRPPRTVNYNKFKRTEDEANALRTQLAKETEARTRIDERLRLINEALASQVATPQPAVEEEEDKAPDPEADIFGYTKWQGRQIEKLSAQLNEVNQERQAQASRQNLQDWYRGQAEQYYQTDEGKPLPWAYRYLIQNRLAELEAGGVADPDQRARIVVDEERQVVETARKQGKNPAMAIMALARGRGFDLNNPNHVPRPQPAAQPAPAANGGTPPPAQPAAQPNQTPAAPGTPLGGAPAPGATPNVAAEIKAIKEAQPAATSLSSGGGAGPLPLTAQQLADMPEDEFQAVYQRLSKNRQREIFGS